ncbi:MAG: hypothetical protein II987_03950 [Clostridia bacterium]|nr:hypothetical protein [Clostridia bacterium]
MTNTDLEKALKEYYTAEAESFALPKDDILARVSENDMIKALPKRKRIFNYKYVAALAACLILFLAIGAVVYKLRGKEDTLRFSNEIVCFDGLQDWYAPGEFAAKGLGLSGNADLIIAQKRSAVRLMSATEKNTYSLPEWVYGAYQLNDRYIQLTCEWPKYEDVIAEMGHNIIYDIQTCEIFSLGNRIIELDSKKVLGHGITCFDINLVELGASEEWCTVEVTGVLYMANIETGEIKQLPSGNIFKISADYKYIATWKATDNGYQIFVLNTETMIKTEITSATDKYYASKNGVFSPDCRYYLQAYYVSEYLASVNGRANRWKIFDLETGESFFAEGTFKKFTAREDAAIFQTASNSETGYSESVVIRLADCADVTESYEFTQQDLFEVTRDSHKSMYSLYVSPLFGIGEKMLLAENVTDYQEWCGYYYIYVHGSDEIIVYSLANNFMFTQRIENIDSIDTENALVSVSVLQQGKQCVVFSYKLNLSIPPDNESQSSPPPETSGDKKDYITALAARNAAIAYLRTEQGLDIKVQSVSHKFDSEKMVYLVTLKTEDCEFRVKVNAIDGTILGWESEKIPVINIPEIKGDVEFLDIPFEVNVITVPVLDPLYAAGLWPWDGGVRLSPEELPIGEPVKEFWEPDKGDPSYNEWIKKYTDEWFEDNWLIVLHGVEKEFNLKHIGFHFEEGKQSKMLFIYDEGDPNFDWDLTYGSKAFIEISKKDIPYDIGETYIITDENGNEFVRDVFFVRALETKEAESNGYELPEVKGKREKLDIDCNVEILKMSFAIDNPGLAGQFQFGHLPSSPEELDLLFDDVWRNAYVADDVKKFDELAEKYTDEWFEENWLVKFIVYKPDFDYTETGVYFSNRENQEPMLYFYFEDTDILEHSERNDPHYHVFVEIPKDNIEYDLSEFYYQLIFDYASCDIGC